jgi:hypothetical protein
MTTLTSDLAPAIEEAEAPTEDIFLRALKIIQERGWTQGYYEDYKGRVCVIGAIREVLTGKGKAERWLTPKQKELSTQLQHFLGALSVEMYEDQGWVEDVQYFNEHPNTTQREVELLLREASIRYASQ